MPPPHRSPSPIPLAQHIPTLVLITLTVLASTLVSRTQPTPYIDEIFHILQAQRYCSALSETSLADVRQVWQKLRGVQYDAKLTTPPGLYAISVGLARLLPGWECVDVAWLRSTNLVLLLTLPVLVARVIRQNDEQGQTNSGTSVGQPRKAPAKKAISRKDIPHLQAKAKLEQPPTPTTSHDDLPAIDPPTITTHDAPPASVHPPSLPRFAQTPYTMAVACTVCFLPPLWFFGFLYYTDLASIWLVLATWTLYNDLNQRPSIRTGVLIALASTWSVLVRQTNIVWVGFCAAQAVLGRVARLSPAGERKTGLTAEVRAALGAAAVGKQSGWKFWRVVSANALPLAPILAGCAWFIRWNGSIVLGDKSNHQAGVHLAQMGYFLAFASGFGVFPLLFSLAAVSTKPTSSKSTLQTARTALEALAQASVGSASSLATLALALAAFYVAVDRYTLEHPFLLADNRHYTFYLWRAFRRSYSLPLLTVQPRYAAVPVYALALIAWGTALARTRSALLGVLFWLATAATLVPTPLIEPRYYLLPYVVLRVMCQPGDGERGGRWTWLGLEAALYAVVNAVTVALFVGRPFEWEADAVDRVRSEGTVMRFIW